LDLRCFCRVPNQAQLEILLKPWCDLLDLLVMLSVTDINKPTALCINYNIFHHLRI
jgi:hypothetical protein